MAVSSVQRVFAGLIVLAASAVVACSSDDDGAAVRESSSGSESASATADESASESASAPAGANGCVFVRNSDTAPTAAVEVRLTEYVVTPLPARVAAGTVQVVGVNTGREVHSLSIVRFDGDPADLPVDGDGLVDETRLPDGAVIGGISPFGVDMTCSAAFDLPAGRYVLYCTLVSEGDDATSHVSHGMATTLTVAA